MATLEQLLKEVLSTETLTKVGVGSGCISSGVCYRTDDGRAYYVKTNTIKEALGMFKGEEASLQAIADTNTILCPKPVKVLDNVPGGGSAIIMDYVNLGSNADEHALGEGLARLHMYNWQQLDRGEGVREFGFDIETSCGSIPQDNKWSSDWPEFFCRKIDYQLSLLSHSAMSKEAKSVWSDVRPKVPKLFEGLVIRPSLLHGDLWSGNIGYTPQGPVIYDAGSFYGHHEYDLGIDQMFPSLGRRFYKAYHSIIPKEAGYETRLKLYMLFHVLNHWNLFGGGYSSQAIHTLRELQQRI